MIRCPNCGNELNKELLACGTENCLSPKYGVARLLRPDFAKQLWTFEKGFQPIREEKGIRIKETALYEQLPYLPTGKGPAIAEWKQFQMDLKILKQQLRQRKKVRILNHGSWNGWLSNHLTNWGHEVTAIGYFIDEYDGLGAQQFYKNNWLSIQMDIEDDLDILEEKYDIIIINRGLAFTKHPIQLLEKLATKLVPNGQVFITGLNIHNNPSVAQENYEAYKKHFKEVYNFTLRLKPTKGYLDKQDKDNLRRLGVQFYVYPDKWLHQIRAMLLPTKTQFYYGIFQQK